MTDHTFKYRNGKIHYTDSGKGKVIVLLHGYLETSEVWRGFSGKLSEKYRVIIPDLPGHGQSDTFGEIHSMELMAEIIEELLNDLKIEKVFLTGHSLGGYVALAFVEKFTERLSGYCLFHSHPLADSPEAFEKRKREINMVQAGQKDLIYPDNITKMFATSNLDKNKTSLERSKKIASAIHGEAIIAILKGMMARPSRLEIMEKGEVPCLWILGAMDNYINCEEVRKKVRLPGNADFVILENSGHMGFVEEEGLSLKAIDTFIMKLE
jgi:pimeloyl-ACP methyl ester carboxylesterase